MADRYASFFGPVLPQEPGAPEAFSFEALQQIRGRRVEADLLRAAPQVRTRGRTFDTILPPPFAAAARPTTPAAPPGASAGRTS